MFGEIRRDHFDVISPTEWTILDVEVEDGALQKGAKILTVSAQTSDPNAEVHVKGDFPIEIGFGERQGGRGGLRASNLTTILEAVERLIETFAEAFEAPGQGATSDPSP